MSVSKRARTSANVFDPTEGVRLPKDYKAVDRKEDGTMWRSSDGLTVIMSGAIEADGNRWIHVSVSHKRRMPRWQELALLKDWLIGEERNVVQVMPRRSQWVNLHENCLHMFAPVDPSDYPLPDFARGGVTI